MGVRESLTLDHFYFNASDEDFAQLLKMKDLFRGFRHRSTEVKGDAWEGLYLYSRAGSYLEVLKNRRVGGFFSICMSPALPMYCDASKITEEIESKWHVYKRVFPDGQPWFDGYYLEKIANEDTSLFQAWIMKQYQVHRPQPAVMAPHTVIHFRKIVLEVGEDNSEEIIKQLVFMPIAPVITEKCIALALPARDNVIFNVEINLVPGSSRFEFRNLSFTFEKDDALDNFKGLGMGKFELTANGRILTLRKD